MPPPLPPPSVTSATSTPSAVPPADEQARSMAQAASTWQVKALTCAMVKMRTTEKMVRPRRRRKERDMSHSMHRNLRDLAYDKYLLLTNWTWMLYQLLISELST